ncbi:MAG: hypothetical protein K5648_07850 [Erysipelotrichaceae bacterium]|nr:hypothetical protein [Erysipelotrichaceae bacterium]
MIIGALTIAGSFTFLHTMLGQNAARAGSALSHYEKVSRDMRYHIREEKGFIQETLTSGAIEVVLSIIMMLMQ